MSSAIAAVAVAVARAINEATPSLELPSPAERRWAPTIRRDELTELRVSVVPGDVETEQLTRGADSWDCEMLIAVQDAMPDGSDDADDRVALLEAIARLFRAEASKQLTTAAGTAHRVGTSRISPPMDPGHFREKNIYTGVVRVTYRVVIEEPKP